MDERDVAWVIRWSELLTRIRACADGAPSGSIALTQQECADLNRGIGLMSRTVDAG